MQNSVYCGFYNRENIFFTHKTEHISQKISEVLPFSKVATLYFANEFFEFGKQLNEQLLKRGIRVIQIILNGNFNAQKENFEDFLTLPEDVRGVVAFNEKLIPLVMSKYLNDKVTFFVEQGKSFYGLIEKYYYIRNGDLLKQIPIKEKLYIIANSDKFSLTNCIKSACLYVNMLIDYVFRQNLLQEKLDMLFVNKIKSILVFTLFELKNKQAIKQESIIEKLIYAQSYLSKKDCFYSCSAVISSFLTNGDFFDMDCSFNASKIIIDKYENILKKHFEIDVIDYNDVAKAISFITKLNQKQILTAIYAQIKSINTKCISSVKEEIQKLILLYKSLSRYVTEDLLEDKTCRQNLLLSTSLSGLTPFGTNGMTIL